MIAKFLNPSIKQAMSDPKYRIEDAYEPEDKLFDNMKIDIQNNKAFLSGLPKILYEKTNGKIPQKIEMDLVEYYGPGRADFQVELKGVKLVDKKSNLMVDKVLFVDGFILEFKTHIKERILNIFFNSQKRITLCYCGYIC